MLKSLCLFLMPYAFFAAMSTAAVIGLYRWSPKLVLIFDSLLTEHPISLGVWFLLSVAGLDNLITTAYRKLRFAEVGAKSAAQLSISRK